MKKRQLPSEVAQEVRELVFSIADSENYLTSSRSDNSRLLSRLVGMSDVGQRLRQFMKRDEVRTYIKDAILNRYAKEKRAESREFDVVAAIHTSFGFEAEMIEADAKGELALYRNGRGTHFVVVCDGTILKWETALRKALLYAASRPFSDRPNVSVNYLLTLFARSRRVSQSDLELLRKALAVCGAVPHVYGEG